MVNLDELEDYLDARDSQPAPWLEAVAITLTILTIVAVTVAVAWLS